MNIGLKTIISLAASVRNKSQWPYAIGYGPLFNPIGHQTENGQSQRLLLLA